MASALAGKRILIVEDEYFIAADLRQSLRQEGVAVVGPVAGLDAGLELAGGPLDAAILDDNLEEALSYPIADRLESRGIPYMFLTGYDGWSLPAGYRDVARVAKPFPIRSVLEIAEKLVSSERERI